MATLNIGADLKNYIVNLIKSTVRDVYYPVGKTYITMGSEDPNKTIGGTWVKIYGGYLYGAKSSLGSTNYSGWGAQSTTLSIDQIPAHRHEETIQTGDGNFNTVCRNRTGGDRSRAIWPENARGGWSNVGSGDIMKTEYSGGGKGHTHDIATIDVWIWKRTK